MRCSSVSLAHIEDQAGTASTVPAFLLLEHSGPWGRTALRDARLPDGLGALLQERCAAAAVRPLLVRRFRSRPGASPPPTVVLATCSPFGGHAASRVLDDVSDVADLPLADLLRDLRAGRVPDGWTPTGPLFLTCTQGRHDACCAELGRPVAAVLDAVARADAWEVSHIGGDRFAGNVLVLPDGIYYGRVTPDRAHELVLAHTNGRVVPDLMRGRSSYPFPVQAAEVAVRRHRGIDGRITLSHSEVRGARTTTVWQVADVAWRVVVETSSPGPARLLTCRAGALSAPPVHTVVEVAESGGPGRGASGWDERHSTTPQPSEPHPLVRELASATDCGRALDVATGTGRHALLLAESGWQVTALDFSTVGLDAGRRAAQRLGLDVDWRLGDARVWSPGAARFDLVLMAFVQLPDVVARARRWLAPGGRLVVVGHALRNLTDGVSGPSDPRLLHTVDSLAAAADPLVVERLEEVVRTTPDGDQVDVVLVARRSPAE